MVRPIMRDIFFLRQKAQPATKEDKQIVQDLLDTLKANEAGCVGMAANMIGVNKRIIAVNMGFINVAMLNPVIVRKSGAYETEEGCLSLDGVRKTTRYENIEVEFQVFHSINNARNILVGQRRSFSMRLITVTELSYKYDI